MKYLRCARQLSSDCGAAQVFDLGNPELRRVRHLGENRAHGRDERIGIREFDENVEYTYRLLNEMGRAD